MKLFTFFSTHAVRRPAAALLRAGLSPKKVISLVTASCFILTSVLGPAAASIPEMRRDEMPLKPAAGEFELPYTAGRVTDARYFGSDDVVINIQDLHCHPEVQKNIARILGFLDERYLLPCVYLEGAIGNVNTSLLGAAGDKKLHDEMIEALLEKGQLTGVEYYSLNSRKYGLIRGLENGKLYKENALRLKGILENKTRIEASLSDLRESLDSLKGTYYGQKNKRIDRIVSAYRAGKYDARRYFGFLIKSAGKSGVDVYGYRNIVNYGRLMDLEKGLNYPRITSELQQFITLLKGTLPYAEYNSLIERTHNFSQLDELYIYLAKLEQAGTVATSRSYPNLNRFFAYIAASQKVNPLGLVSEERKLLREIETRNAGNVPERDVVFLQDFFRHIEDYANNRISADDYEYYVANLTAFKSILGTYTADDTLASFAPFARTLDDFYRVNMERNEAFLQNTIGGNARGPAGAAGENDASKVFASVKKGGRLTVTITGGFHTDGLANILRERKISYVIVTPNVTQDTKSAETVYTQLISEQARVLNQTLAALILAQYPFSETARRNAAAAFTAFIREGVDPHDTAALRKIFNDRVFGPLAKEYEKSTGKKIGTFEIESIQYNENKRHYLFAMNLDGMHITFNENGELLEGETPTRPLLGADEVESLIARWFDEDALNDALDVINEIRNDLVTVSYSLASFLNWTRPDIRALDRKQGEKSLQKAFSRSRTSQGYAFQADVDKLREMNSYLGKANVDFLISRYLDAMHKTACSHGGFVVRWGGDEAMGFVPGKLSKRRAMAIFDGMREEVIDTFRERYGVAVLPDVVTLDQYQHLLGCPDVISFDQERGFVLFNAQDHNLLTALARVQEQSGIPDLRLHEFNGGWLFYPTVSLGVVDISKIPEAKDSSLGAQRFAEIVAEYAARAVHKAKANGRNRTVCEIVQSSGHETGISTIADSVEPDVAKALRATPLRDVPREQGVRDAASRMLSAGEQMTVVRLLPSYKGEGLKDIPSSKGNGWLRFKSINDSDLYSYRGGDDTIRLNYACGQIDLEEELKKLVGEAHIARGTTDDLVVVFKGALDNDVLMDLVDRLTARINANSKLKVGFDVVAARSDKDDTHSGFLFRKVDYLSKLIQPSSPDVSSVITPEHSKRPGSENRFFTYDPARRYAIYQAIKAIHEFEGRQSEQNLEAIRNEQLNTPRARRITFLNSLMVLVGAVGLLLIALHPAAPSSLAHDLSAQGAGLHGLLSAGNSAGATGFMMFGGIFMGMVQRAQEEFVPGTTEKSRKKKTWLEEKAPDLAGKKIVEVTMEMALSGEMLKLLEAQGLSANEMRAAAMATSTGGIGPLLKERVIAQGKLGADVTGVSLLYDNVWVQKTLPDGTLTLEKVEVGKFFRRACEKVGELPVKMYDGETVTATVWKAPAGAYGKGTAYFLDCPSITNVVYPGSRDVSNERYGHELRHAQSWLLGRGTLALMQRIEQKQPDLIVMSEAPSMYVHHRMFQDEFSEDPFFDNTKYVFNDYTPLEYAHPYLDQQTLDRLRVAPRFYKDLTFSADGRIDATAMIINAADGVFGVAEKHARVMRAMPLLKQFGEKIRYVTNGVSQLYWPADEFDLDRVRTSSDEQLLALKDRKREELIRWLADRQGLGDEWAENAIRNKQPVGIWTRQIVEYKRLERFADMLSDPQKRQAFLSSGIIFVFGGRIHEDDTYGLNQYNRIQKLMADDARLKGRVIFFDNYNIWEAPRLFHGADFSVMLADDGREASATGFLKAQMNGDLIIAAHDGAVPESVTFYDGTNAGEANGFNVPFSGNGEPTVQGFFDALMSFSAVYKDKHALGQMVRNALKQTRRVSVDRAAEDMLMLFSDVVRGADARKESYEKGRREARTALHNAWFTGKGARSALSAMNGSANPFIWKFKAWGTEERTIAASEPGVKGFLNSFAYVTGLGSIGEWSLLFHAFNRDGRGDILACCESILESIPDAAVKDPVLKQLHTLISDFRDTNDPQRKIRIMYEAVGLLADTFSQLERASGVVVDEPEPLPEGIAELSDTTGYDARIVREGALSITDNLASRIHSDASGNRYVEDGMELKIEEHRDKHLQRIVENRGNIVYVFTFAGALAAILRDLEGAGKTYNAALLRAYCLELLNATLQESLAAFERNPAATEQLIAFYAGIIAGIEDKKFIEGLADDAFIGAYKAIPSVQAKDLDAMESGAYTPNYLAVVRIMKQTKKASFFAVLGQGLATLKQSVKKGDFPGDRNVQLDVIDFLLAENTALFGGLYRMRRTARKAFDSVSALHPTALVSGNPLAGTAENATQAATWASENAPEIAGIPFMAVRERLSDQDIDALAVLGERGVRCPVAFTFAAEDEYLPDDSFLFTLAIPARNGQPEYAGAYLEKVSRNGVTVYIVKLDYRRGTAGDRTYILGRGTNAFLKQLFDNPVAMQALGLEDRAAGAGAIIHTGDNALAALYANSRAFIDPLSKSLSGSTIIIVSSDRNDIRPQTISPLAAALDPGSRAAASDGRSVVRRNADVRAFGTESPEQLLADCGRKMVNKKAESAALRGGSNLNIRFDVTQLRNRPDREDADQGTGKLLYIRPFFDALKGVRGGNVYVQMGKVYDDADPRVVNDAIVSHSGKAGKGDRSARMQKYAGLIDTKRFAALEGFEQFEDAVSYIHQNGGKVTLDYAIPAGADLAVYRAAIIGWAKTFGIDAFVIDLSGRTDLPAVEQWYLALCEEVRLARPETELPLLLAPQFESASGRLAEQTGQKRVMIWEGDSESVPAHMTGEKVFLKVMPRQDSEAVWENISGAVSKAPVADVSIPVPGEVFSGARFKPEGENPFTLAQVSEYVHRMVARVVEPYAKGYAVAMQYDKKYLPNIDSETSVLFEAKEITLADGTKMSATALYAPLALYRRAQSAGSEKLMESGQCLSLAVAAAKLLPGAAGRIVEDKVVSLQQAAEGGSAETVAALTRELAGYWEGVLGRVLTEQYIAAHGALPFAGSARQEAFSRLLVSALGSMNGKTEGDMTVETLNVMAVLGFRTAAARFAKDAAPRMRARMQETAKAGNLTVPFMTTMLNFVNLSYNYMSGRNEGVLAETANDILATITFHIGSLSTDQNGAMRAAYLEALQSYPIKGGNRSEFMDRSRDVAQSLVNRYPSARIREELKKSVPQAGDQDSLERYLAQVNLLITVMKTEGNTAPDIRSAVEPFLPPLMEAMEKGSLSQPGAIAEALRILDILNNQEKNLTADRIESTVIKNLDKTIRGTARIRSAA